jgi:hypothetical protein
MKFLTHKPFFLIAIISFLALSVACNQGQKDRIPADVVTNPVSAESGKETEVLPRMVFEKDVHDFGRLIQGEMISYSFHFTNEGKSPLVIADVKASCGCTIADFPGEAVPPGEKAYVTVTFDSKGRRGFQSKQVTVVANTVPNMHTLKVTADIIRPEE